MSGPDDKKDDDLPFVHPPVGSDMSPEEYTKRVLQGGSSFLEEKLTPEESALIAIENLREDARNLLRDIPGAYEKLSEEDIQAFQKFCEPLDIARRDFFLKDLLNTPDTSDMLGGPKDLSIFELENIIANSKKPQGIAKIRADQKNAKIAFLVTRLNTQEVLKNIN